MRLMTLTLVLLLTTASLFANDQTWIEQLSLTGSVEEANAKLHIRNESHTMASSQADQTKKSAYLQTLIQAIQASSSPEVKAFLMGELQYIGAAESIPVLAGYLQDVRLHQDAISALLSISQATNHAEIERRVAAAFLASHESTQVALAKACGSLAVADVQVTHKLSQLAKSEDWEIRRVALYALSCIADDTCGKILKEAIHNVNLYQRGKSIQYFFDYCRLSSKRNLSKAIQECRDMMAAFVDSKDTSFYVNGLSTLLDIQGESMLDELISNLSNPNPRIQAGVVQLLIHVNHPNYNKKILSALKDADRLTQVNLMQILISNDIQLVVPFLMKSLSSEDTLIRHTALNNAAKFVNVEVIRVLVNDLLKDSKAEQNMAVEVLKRIHLDASSEAFMVDAYQQAKNNDQKLAFLEVFTERFVRTSSATVINETKSDHAEVQKAALKALKNTAAAEQIPNLISLLQHTEGSKELRFVQQGLGAALKLNQDTEHVKLVIQAKDLSKDKQREAFLAALTESADDAAFNAIVEEAKSKNEIQQKQGFKALSLITSGKGATTILALLPEATEANRILGIRGMLQCSNDMDRAQRDELLKAALKFAVRDEEKMLIDAAIKKS